MIQQGKVILLLFLIFIFSCKGKTTSVSTNDTAVVVMPETKPVQQQDTFKTGQVFQLTCLNDQSKSYAVYLPAAYSKTNPLPVIYFFDPHADGSLPVKKYTAIAEVFNWILIGCNNSKNGMQLQESQAIAQGMIADVASRFFINSKLQYLSGFSGGSKVACSVAGANNTVAGLIACSGSYVNKDASFSPGLNIVSIAGERDFNYHEMVQFNEFVGSNNAHLFISTDNTHEWPTVDAMRDAFVFMLMRDMQKGLVAEKKEVVKSYIETYKKKSEAFAKRNDVYAAYTCYQNIVATFKGIADVTFAEKEIAALEKSSAYKSYIEKKQKLYMQEPQLQQYYAEAMQSKDITWWNNEIGNLKKSADLKSDKLWSAYNSRMLGFLGIMCYSYSGKAVKANAAETSKFLSIYKAVEPDNTESYFLSAVYAANNSNVELASQELKLALQKGFNEKQRLNEYPSLSAVIYRADIKAMLDTIH